LLEVVVVVVGAGQGGKQAQPCQRCGGESRLAEAARQGERFADRAAQRGPPTGEQLRERQPLQPIDDHHAGTTLAGTGHLGRIEEARRVVVAEIQGGVAEIPRHVQVVNLTPGRHRSVERGHRARPVALGRGGQGAQQQPQAPGAGRIGTGLGEQTDLHIVGEDGSAVAAVGACQRGRGRHLHGPGRVQIRDGARR
jgi:hypothetical protein